MCCPSVGGGYCSTVGDSLKNTAGPAVSQTCINISLLTVSTMVTSAKEVIFSSAFVCLLAGLRDNYLTDFHKVRWNGGTWATEEIIRLLVVIRVTLC